MPPKKLKTKYASGFQKFPTVFIVPALIFLVVFSIVPILIAFWSSLTNLNFAGLMNPAAIQFAGFQNYNKLFASKDFFQALTNTVVFAAIGVPLTLVLSLGAAVLLSRGEKGLFGTYRVVYYLPSLTNVVAISVVFGYIFNSNFGLLNFLLSKIGVEPVMWLLDPFMAKVSIIILAIWRGLGINIIIFLAALKSIPKSLFEAAEMDGAGGFTKLIKVVIPSIKFAIFYVSMTSMIIWLQLFEESFVLTQGGPLGATTSIVQFTYKEAFTNRRFGYAAAASVVLFLIIMTVTIVQNIMRNRSEQE